MDAVISFVEQQLSSWDVPGAAVVAVKDDAVVLSRGFGVRRLGAPDPVTPDTLFAIGSTTKALTAAAVGGMVDDGLLEWEKPLRDYIPGFRLHDAVATERINAVDLLSHRSGLPRHEFAWLGHEERSRAEVVSRLRHLPLSEDIRAHFQYCNLGYITIGYLIEAVTGMTWEEYLITRLLKPLGMDRSNVSVAVSQRDDDHAKPHQLRGDDLVEIDFRAIDQPGPAGGINSSINDMAHWLRVNLGAGRVGDRQVISSDTVARMHRSKTVIPEDVTFPESTRYAYGLGWAIGQYRGHRIVEHNGGIDGFLTECMLLPNDGIGVVVLTNSFSHAMGPPIAYRVLDELLGVEPIDWATRFKERYDAALAGSARARTARPRVEGAGLPRAPEAYVGDYEHPGYGRFSITVDGDSLVPAFGSLKLAMTHRHFDVFDLEWYELTEDSVLFALQFLSDPDGDIVALTIPFEPSLKEPIHFDRLPDERARDPQVLAMLEGSYVMGPIEIVIGRRAERTLTVATPGNPVAELVATRGLRFSIKSQPSTTLEFVLDASGAVEKVVVQPMGIFQPKP